MIKYRVLLKNTETGETRLTGEFERSRDDMPPYWWTDGNMACDCNRHTEFDRANGENLDGMSPDYQCNSEPNRFIAIEFVLEDGTVIEYGR